MEPMEPSNTGQVTQGVRLAGFWIRFVAVFIDGLIMAAVRWPLSLLLAVPQSLLTRNMEQGGAAVGVAFGMLGLNMLVGIAVAVAYTGWFYSTKGATPGKMLLKLKVVNADTGTYLTFGQACLRDIVGKFVSGIIFMIGYLMAAFRKDKRALHDLMVGSQVIRHD